MKDLHDKVTGDLLAHAKRDKTAAARMARMRAKKGKEFPHQLRAAYLRGFDDAKDGKKPVSVEIWGDKNTAIAYICGGLDGTGELNKEYR